MLENQVCLPRVVARKYDGSEPLPSLSEKTVLDYWRWAHNGILENVQRGVYAEFLVAAALDITKGPRIPWAPYDLDYENYKIEVKSSVSSGVEATGTLQISFGIGARLALDPDLPMETDPRYHADCFVFCVFADTDPSIADVLDASRWRFYVVPITRLIDFCGTAKSVVENRVKQITSPVSYENLKDRIVATRDKQVFLGSGDEQHGPSRSHGRLRSYAVWERGTRSNPVVVEAANADDAFLLARADPTLANSRKEIAAERLSTPMALRFIANGAIDLRKSSS